MARSGKPSVVFCFLFLLFYGPPISVPKVEFPAFYYIIIIKERLAEEQLLEWNGATEEEDARRAKKEKAEEEEKSAFFFISFQCLSLLLPLLHIPLWLLYLPVDGLYSHPIPPSTIYTFLCIINWDKLSHSLYFVSLSLSLSDTPTTFTTTPHRPTPKQSTRRL